MKSAFHHPWKLVFFVFFSFVFFSDFVISDTTCPLNFTQHPYQTTGDCIGKQKEIRVWNGVSTTICCRKVLDSLTEALAFHANSSPGASIFIDSNTWHHCTDEPFVSQGSVSVNGCGFSDLFDGNSGCSVFSLLDIQHDQFYKDALDSCSGLTSSFADSCAKCSASLVKARDHLIQSFAENNHDDYQTEICSIAIVVAVAAAKSNDRNLTDDFYRCLPILDEFDSGYLKIRYSVVKALVAILIALGTIMLLLLLIKYVTKSKFKKPLTQSKQNVAWESLYRFSKAEIENAINYGNEFLGRGSAGQVYKGVLPSGQMVAIKHIHNSSKSDSFAREVDGLLRVRHANLVCLFGCCVEDGEQYLVYEYCSAGNLAHHLQRKDIVVPWERRVKILRDCALALRYLHHYIDGCIVHRDIKLTNILLTDNLDPKLSDFGLAKMLGMEESKVFTEVRGTIGYMDPEYMSNAKLTCASDIYSFGIVMLQLLSGQKVIELDLDARDQLTRKAKDVSLGNRPQSDFEDPRLDGDLNRADFQSILQIAVLCVAKSSNGRPTIDMVFDELDKAWKNTDAEMKAKNEICSMTSLSTSMEAFPV